MAIESEDAKNSELVNGFAYHYAQGNVWRAEADKHRAAGRNAEADYAEQHALGHAHHVAHLRDQMPYELHTAVQQGANAHSRKSNFLDSMPDQWKTPQPATEVPVNGGGRNGTLKWTPPGEK
jgi:hypothetical protein